MPMLLFLPFDMQPISGPQSDACEAAMPGRCGEVAIAAVLPITFLHSCPVGSSAV